jgi:hypothetical protein
MMVMASGEPADLDVTNLLQKLATTKETKQKTEAYNKLVE